MFGLNDSTYSAESLRSRQKSVKSQKQACLGAAPMTILLILDHL